MLFTHNQLVRKANKKLFDEFGVLNETRRFSKAKEIILEKAETYSYFDGHEDHYDIFLSHSTDDALEVLGLVDTLEDLGYSVYVDWIEDPRLDRSNVTRENAQLIKERMTNCNSLFFAFSLHAKQSVWMPWELGYFDGLNGKAAIIPIASFSSSTLKGSEFLKLYYYITLEKSNINNEDILWVNENPNTYIDYDTWINENKEPYYHKR